MGTPRAGAPAQAHPSPSSRGPWPNLRGIILLNNDAREAVAPGREKEKEVGLIFVESLCTK